MDDSKASSYFFLSIIHNPGNFCNFGHPLAHYKLGEVCSSMRLSFPGISRVRKRIFKEYYIMDLALTNNRQEQGYQLQFLQVYHLA